MRSNKRGKRSRLLGNESFGKRQYNCSRYNIIYFVRKVVGEAGEERQNKYCANLGWPNKTLRTKEKKGYSVGSIDVLRTRCRVEQFVHAFVYLHPAVIKGKQRRLQHTYKHTHTRLVLVSHAYCCFTQARADKLPRR